LATCCFADWQSAAVADYQSEIQTASLRYPGTDPREPSDCPGSYY